MCIRDSHRAVLALVGRQQRARAAGRVSVLPAEGDGAAGAELRERLPGRHRAVHGPLQFLRRRRQAVMYPFCDAERADHPVRHLQPALPRRPHRRHSRRVGRRAARLIGACHGTPSGPDRPYGYFRHHSAASGHLRCCFHGRRRHGRRFRNPLALGGMLPGLARRNLAAR